MHPFRSCSCAHAPSSIQLNGTGPNKERQESAHPHQVIIHEEYQELLIPDLGSDIVRRFKKIKGSWKFVGHVGIELGGGPRHVAFYSMCISVKFPALCLIIFPDGDLFTLLELKNKVVRHRFPALPALPSLVKSVPTMSNPPPAPNEMLAGEILIPQIRHSRHPISMSPIVMIRHPRVTSYPFSRLTAPIVSSL